MKAILLRRRQARAGFSLVEALVSSFIFVSLLVAVYAALGDSISFSGVQDTYAQMQMDAKRALERMSTELRMTGRFDNPIPGQPGYPYIFFDGKALGTFEPLRHDAPARHLAPGNPAYGETREPGFKIPEDLDGDGLLTDAATGNIEWTDHDISYALITDPNGINVLYRSVDGNPTDILARYVERITFDTIDTDASIDLNEIVITVYMARPDNDGNWLQTTLSTCVTMRNTEEVH